MVEDRKEGERCQRWESLQDGIYELTLSSLINISAHLSKFLVDESKFESVVHFVFVIGHYQLGPLHIHKNSHFPLSPPRSLISLNLLHTFSLLWLLGKHVFPLYRHVSRVGLLGPRYVRLTCNKPPRSSARAAILSLPLADRDTDGFFFFSSFPFRRHRLKACSITLLHRALRRRDRSILCILGSCCPLLISSIIFRVMYLLNRADVREAGGPVRAKRGKAACDVSARPLKALV